MAKKKKGNKMLLLLVLILLIIIILFLVFCSDIPGFGFGNGSGTGSDSDYAGADQSISDISDVSENTASGSETGASDIAESVTETEILLFDITVMGNVYLYQNQETGLEHLLSEIQSQENYYMVRITDDNATQNAMEDLLNALQESEITYALKCSQP